MRKRFVTVEGHRLSISLEDAFWTELIAICRARRVTLEAFVAQVNAGGGDEESSLSAALRAYILRDLVRRRELQRRRDQGLSRDILALRMERRRQIVQLIARSNEALQRSARLLAAPVYGGSTSTLAPRIGKLN